MTNLIFELESSRIVMLCLLSLAVFRIYLEIVGFKLSSLPIGRAIGEEKSHRIHKMGLYFSIGYFVLFAPQFLLS